MRTFIILSIIVVLLSVTFDSEAWSLTPESQKILNNYHNFEQTGSPPATSQPYSPNNSPPEINVVPAPKTNVVPPITSQPSYSSSPNVQNNSPSGNSPPNSPFIWVGIVLMFVVFVLVKIFRRGSTTHQTSTYEPLTRRGWTELEKEEIRIRQDGKCNKCGRPPPRWEYHHKDGNRSNNSLRNCEGLCPNCHSVRTHDE